MFIPAIFTGAVILSAGIYMFVKGRKNNRLLEKYEFENRDQDGVIYFKSKESSRTHGANKNLSKVITIMGVFTGLFGFILLGYGFNLFVYP